MRKITLALAALFCTAAMFAAPKPSETTVKASDPRITFIGRTQVDDGTVSFDWTGTYARISFKGSYLSMKVSDTKRNYYNVWIDSDMKEPFTKKITVTGKDTTIFIFTPEEMKSMFGKGRKALETVHKVVIQKRTEGEQGTTSIESFSTDGDFLQAEGPKERIIEYVGDSYTCGYGTEASNKERWSPETENQNLTYACAAARYFDADQIVIAHSGMGIRRNYNGNIADYSMKEEYLKTFDINREIVWDAAASELKPDVTVIYLGTNDFSTGLQPSRNRFANDYTVLLKEIKANYGEDHPIICVASKNDIILYEYILYAVDHCGLRNVSTLAFAPSVHNNDEDMGADGHPSYKGHIKLAYALIPYISTVTGWEMKDIIK